MFRLAIENPGIFTFADFMSGLAIVALAWTTAGARYKFRIAAAPIPIENLTLGMAFIIGLSTLLTDLALEEHWLVPYGYITPAQWQAILGGTYLGTILVWASLAFRPAGFNGLTAHRFKRAVARVILKSSPPELAEVADEISYAAAALVHHASNANSLLESDHSEKEQSKVAAQANQVLLLIADKPFCRAVAESSPRTALALFTAVRRSRKYRIPISIFAHNVVSEALANKDSFLFRESGRYASGLIGNDKPLTRALFGDYELVETVGTLLAPDSLSRRRWDGDQWKAYCRVTLVTLEDYLRRRNGNPSAALFDAFERIAHSMVDAYHIRALPSGDEDDRLSRLEGIVAFVRDAIDLLDDADIPTGMQSRPPASPSAMTVYDHLATIIYEVTLSLSFMEAPSQVRWHVQYACFWGQLFGFGLLDSPAGKIVKRKACRLIYDDIASVERIPHFQNTALLAFCMYILGFEALRKDYHRDTIPLQRATHSLLKRYFPWLHQNYRHIVERTLAEGLAFDEADCCLVRTDPIAGLDREPGITRLALGCATGGALPRASSN